jgi:8-oxo-dGTP diphosphatase
MSDRGSARGGRSAVRRIGLSIDIALLTPRGRQLAVFVARQRGPGVHARRALPWDTLRPGEQLEDAARRIARSALGAPPAWLSQVGAFGGRRRHPSGAEVSVAFLALAPGGERPGATEGEWLPVAELPGLAARQHAMVEGAVAAVRAELDRSPIAFRLLPPVFTLSQLQEVYELILGRRLHKASFRRALHAARLVEPTDRWRSEGRGRPAQLFRYAPRKRRAGRRGVRFELGGE